MNERRESELADEDPAISSFDPGNFGTLAGCVSGSERALRILEGSCLQMWMHVIVLVEPSGGSRLMLTTVADGTGILSQMWTVEVRLLNLVHIAVGYHRGKGLVLH